MNLVNKLNNKLRRLFRRNKILLFKYLVPLKRYKIENSIIISSEPRSGSTWLMELIQSVPGTIVNWEPLHELDGVVPANYRWGERPYIPEDNNDPDAIRLMERILRFKALSPNSIRFTPVADLFTSNKVITKMVRSNLLLPWLTRNFKFKHSPVYLLRHPIAVASAQIRYLSESQKTVSTYKVPNTINNDRYKEHSTYLNSLKTILERLTAIWCIHNVDIINYPDSNRRWIVVYYEDLLLYPEKEMIRIGKEMNLDVPIDESNFEKPSKTNFQNQFRKDKYEQLTKWKNDLNENQITDLQKIFDYFSLKVYDAQSPVPVNSDASVDAKIAI